MPIAISGWLSIIVAAIAALFAAVLFGRNLGIESQRPELNARDHRIAVLEAANTVASAEALRRGQEAAQAARAIEDEQRRRIEEAEALYASYEAAAAIAADERERRLRSALDARSCRANSVRRARVSEAADVESRSAAPTGVLVDTTARNLREFGDDVDRLAGQYAICYSAVRTGREVSR